MYGCLCDVLKMQDGTPNVNLRATSPGVRECSPPGELACLLAYTAVQSFLRLPNCCLEKPVDKMLKQMKYAATSQNDIQLNATG